MKLKNILILAGGDGTRFWPLGDKNLFTFLGKSVTGYQIQRFLPYAEKLTIVVNDGNGNIIEHIVKEIDVDNIRLIRQVGEGQASGLLSCQGQVTGEALVVNNDDFFNYDQLLKSILDIKDDFQIVLTAKEIADYLPGGYLKLEGNQVHEVIEKPSAGKMPSHFFRLVVDYYKDFERLLKAISEVKTDRDDYYEQGINKYISAFIKGINKYLTEAEKRRATFVKYDGYYYTLKFPWQVLSVMNYFLSTLEKDEIRVGKNAKIAKSAKIIGPTYIGENTIIGDYAMIRKSHIGANCLIGGYCEVTRSYIGDDVMLHRNYVGDSVLDQGVLMGSGAVTANFRFDGKTILSKVGDKKIDTKLRKFGAIIGRGAKIGVNSTLLPGIKIGKNTWIGPGEIVREDAGDNKFMTKGKTTENIQIRQINKYYK